MLSYLSLRVLIGKFFPLLSPVPKVKRLKSTFARNTTSILLVLRRLKILRCKIEVESETT